MFWGEQPPFTPIGCGGRYFFGVRRKRRTPNSESFCEQSSDPMLKSESGRISWPAAFTLAALLAALVTAFIFYRTETWPLRTTHQAIGETERVARDIKDAFVGMAHLQPRITINNRVYMEQTMPASELVAVSRRIEVEHELVHSWAGSSKRVKLHGTFTVKAGFDFRQDVAIDIRPEEIVVQLPHAQLLGVEQEQVDVLAFENGLWNKISGEDVQSELSILPELARQRASDLPIQAEQALQRQLAERIHAPQPLHLVFKDKDAAKKD